MGNAKIVNVPNCIMGLFWCSKIAPILASNMEHGLLLLPSCAGHWDNLRLPKQKQKRKNTLYLSHKNPFNGLTIIFNTMKVLTLVIFLSTCDYNCSLLSHFWVYTVFFQLFALAPSQAVLCRTEAARNAVTNHRRPWEAERRKPSPSHLPLRAYFHVERLVWIRGRYFHVLC